MKKIKAVIDIGTNSIKFCVGKENHDRFILFRDEVEVVKLGDGLHETGIISGCAMERGLAAVKKFVEKAKFYCATEIVAVGTMALRSAKNAGEFIRLVRENCGVEVRVISGEEEARLAFLAASSLARGKNCIVFDTGGGSTEIIYGNDETVFEKQSFNLGAIRLTEKYFLPEPISQKSLEEACSEIESILRNGNLTRYEGALVGVGGAVTAMASVNKKMTHYYPEKINGSTISLDDVNSQIDLYASLTLEERKKIAGLQPKRAEIILAGACVVKAIMDYFKIPEFRVCSSGIRHVILNAKRDIIAAPIFMQPSSGVNFGE